MLTLDQADAKIAELEAEIVRHKPEGTGMGDTEWLAAVLMRGPAANAAASAASDAARQLGTLPDELARALLVRVMLQRRTPPPKPPLRPMYTP